MTGVLKVDTPGLHSTVQDTGRYGYQQFGVPVSGALDAEAYAIANALVGNAADLAAIEFRFAGPTLAVAGREMLVALTGTTAALDIDGPEPRRIRGWSSGIVRPGEVIKSPALKETSTAYIAVAGGVATTPVLGSRATYVRGAIGGHRGRALQAGDELPIGEQAGHGEPMIVPEPPRAARDRLRVTLGPQDHMFATSALEILCSATFTVTAQSDRMGLRLKGPELAHRSDYNIASDGIATGAIQVPGNRQPILLLADHQTTGGYPKIANVIVADLPVAGRLLPGDALTFAAVTVDEAERIAGDARRRLARTVESIRPLRRPGEIDIEALYRESLISGVV